MKSEIKLPFALNEHNVVVHINDVERGKKCNCICPVCGCPLIAAKGNKIQHHFKHKIITDCENASESAIHLAAKQMIMKKKQITLPRYIVSVSGKDSKEIEHSESEIIVQNGTKKYFDTVQKEIYLNEIKVDILALENKTPFIIEIFYRHKVNDQKIVKIKHVDISAIEIDLRDLIWEDVKNWESFWLSINDPKRIKWLYNVYENRSSAYLKSKLLRQINLQEQKYKEEIQSNPLWKFHSEFTLENLPDCFNVDVPQADLVFDCDRRVWQIALYSFFIKSKQIGSKFSIKQADDWLRSQCNVPNIERVVGRTSEKSFFFLTANIENIPASWDSLLAYFYSLCDLKLIMQVGDDLKNPGSFWFKVMKF